MPLPRHLLSAASIESSAAHVAFSATSKAAVRNFYAAALQAGGRPNGSPSYRDPEGQIFNAAVLDLDGNSIEVMFREHGPDTQIIEHTHSRVITYRSRTVDESEEEESEEEMEEASVTPLRVMTMPKSTASAALSLPRSKAGSIARSKAPSVARSISLPTSLPTQSAEPSRPGDVAAKTVIGTLLGAAAGAAVAYAMCKSEQDSAQKEVEFTVRMAEKEAERGAPPAPQTAPAKARSSRPPVHRNFSVTDSVVPESRVHRNFSVTESTYSTATRRQWKAIEPAPEPQSFETMSYHSPTYVSLAPTRVGQQQEQQRIEYVPAVSVTGGRSTAARSEAPRGEAPRSAFKPSEAPTRGSRRDTAPQRAIEYVPAASTAKGRSRAPGRTPSQARTANYAPTDVSASTANPQQAIEYVPAASAADRSKAPSKAPSPNYAATDISASSAKPSHHAAEYVPAASVAARSSASPTYRSVSSPVVVTQKAIVEYSHPHSTISEMSPSFPHDDRALTRRDSGMSVASHHSRKSRHSHRNERSPSRRSSRAHSAASSARRSEASVSTAKPADST